MNWTKQYYDKLWDRAWQRAGRFEDISSKIKTGVTFPDISNLKIGEARLIEGTILFVDIVSFTARSERSNPHDLLLTLDIFLAEMSEIVNDWGGTIEKFTGDGLMAIFDTAYTDNQGMVKNVIDAATTMAYVIGGPINGYLEGQKIEPLNFRIGIDGGNVLVGKLGVRSDNDPVTIGWSANIASKLCDTAPVNGVLIGNYVYSLLPKWEQDFCVTHDFIEGWNYIIKGTTFRYPFYIYRGRWKIPQ